MSDNKLMKAERMEPPQGITPQPSPAQMMQQMITAGVTEQNVAAFKELVILSEHMEDRQAKKDFGQAFIALQADIPTVKATEIIPNKGGVGMRSSYAPFEEIDRQTRPICLRHGFTYSFSEGPFQQGKIAKVFTLLHGATGIEKSNSYSVRIGQGPPAASEAQADGAAHSYAKRGALCDGLNIVVTGIDDDARLLGDVITRAQAEELEHRLKMINGDVAAFLQLAEAESFDKIHALKYSILDQMLRMKEQRKK